MPQGVRDLVNQWLTRYGQRAFRVEFKQAEYVAQAMAITGSDDYEKVSLIFFFRIESHFFIIIIYIFFFFTDEKTVCRSSQETRT